MGTSSSKRKQCLATYLSFWHISEQCLATRDEYWTGLGLDWTRTMPNFVEYGLDPGCKLLHKFRIRIGFGLRWKIIA